ncbi:3'-phosphatase [Escherichia coli]|uniref:phosphatase domain-containing protein n=1 Tax=Escherichia coli TaxID=562 RepID=UPI00101FE08F|nr:3'-phosphatase [Escherichia coli]EAP0475197.1 3'-phosphatase [Salmonella enterica]EAP0531084.1 3'-phosphatase [Salmonella enterica]EFL7402713.1 3'-phosphatase [Escherichia coli]EFU6041483.1 3'-phosphatase [Escherichia coli]ELM7943230.1 3'-phosphatase [Escherichia coli]
MSIFNKHAHQERPYIVIVDIDGTISKATEDRLHLLPPPGKGALTKDWNEFNLACDTDTPITPVIDMVRQLFNVYTVWFVTGRCEIARDKTRAWLRKYVTNGAEPLLSMRPATDDRNDGPAKIDLLKKIGLSKIAFALEDKIEVARVFRRHGVLTLMVREYENALLHQQ